MNKKILVLALVTAILCNVATGCNGNKDVDIIAQMNSLETMPPDIVLTVPTTSETTESQVEITPSTEEFVPSVSNSMASDVDVDLTLLSSTMVYSEVYNMLMMPDEYIGKEVRMQGTFVIYTNQDQSQYYPAVIIADATACCSQGIEFVLEGEPVYPEGYPEVNTEITVVGEFETYDENGITFCHLINAVVE